MQNHGLEKLSSWKCEKMVILSRVLRISMKIFKWSLINGGFCELQNLSNILFQSLLSIRQIEEELPLTLKISHFRYARCSNCISVHDYPKKIFCYTPCVELNGRYFWKKYKGETIKIDLVMVKIIRPPFFLDYALNRNKLN